MIADTYGVENIVGKGENAGEQLFLLFSQCFQKSTVTWLFKSQEFVITSIFSFSHIFFQKSSFTSFTRRQNFRLV